MMSSQTATDKWFAALKEAATKDPTYIQRTYEVEVDVRNRRESRRRERFHPVGQRKGDGCGSLGS